MRYLELEELLAAPAISSSRDVTYIPLPNVVDVLAVEALAPDDLNPTSFVYPFLADGTLVLANNRRRGPEVPGGHREPGETAAEGAIREAFEETGCIIEALVPVGIFRSSSTSEKPEGYRYPFPYSCQQFFAGVVVSQEAYVENDECLSPIFVRSENAPSVLRERELSLFKLAYEKLFGLSASYSQPSI